MRNLWRLGVLFICCMSVAGSGSAQEGERRELLITGCGRAGTLYMADVLQEAGVDVRHEYDGSYGRIAWSCAVGPYDDRGNLLPERTYAHIFHQVRHPLKVIHSWYANFRDLYGPEWVFIRKHIPEIQETDSLLVQCAKYWYYWNLRAEQIAEWRYRIEDFDQVVDEFASRLGIVINHRVLHKIHKDVNHRIGHRYPLKWDVLRKELPSDLYHNIVHMAIRYGYTLHTRYIE